MKESTWEQERSALDSEGAARALSAERLADLERLTDSALGYLSLEAMLSELLERIRDTLSADTAAVLLLDEERSTLVARAAKGIEEEVRQGVQVPLGSGFAGRIAAERRPVVLDQVTWPNVVNPLLERRGIRSLLGVPLLVEGRVIGVLHVGTLSPRTFTEDDISLLQFAADRAALAIDNAQLSEQRAVTQVMQRALLPAGLPDIPGLRFSAKYLPAGSGMRIGGDWYDIFQLPDGRVGFVIGDVVGRGANAASVMAEIRTALRAYLLEGHELGKGMSLLNELLASIGRRRSATAVITALDLEHERLTIVSAGHLPVLMVPPREVPRLITAAQGPPLGVGHIDPYDERSVPFPAGSSLLLYTDGLVERRGESIDEGLQRLLAAAEEEGHAREVTLADRVYAALVREDEAEDDVALLAIESVPLGSELEMTLEAAPRVLAGLRRTLGRWLLAHGVGDDDRFAVVLAVSEAAGNAIEHAYGPLEARFTVRCSFAAGEVRVEVTDNGAWRGATRSGRGRGLVIMRELTDATEVNREPGGTTVVLTKRVEVP